MSAFDDKTNAYERVYSAIKHSIIIGDFAPGQKLKEAHLAEHLNTSRTPVREALRKLENEGLVVVHRAQGATVTGLTKESLVHVYECRAVLEGLAAFSSAQRINQAQLTELEECVMLGEQYLSRGDEARLIEKNTRFHVILLDASGNPMLQQLMQHIRSHVLRYRSVTSAGGFRPEFPEEHRQIFAAIRDRRPGEAETAMKEHVRKDMQEMLRRIEVLR